MADINNTTVYNFEAAPVHKHPENVNDDGGDLMENMDDFDVHRGDETNEGIIRLTDDQFLDKLDETALGIL